MGISDPTHNSNNGANNHHSLNHFDVDEAARRLQIHILARQALTRAIEQERQYVSVQQQKQQSIHRNSLPLTTTTATSSLSATRQRTAVHASPSLRSQSNNYNVNTHSVRTNPTKPPSAGQPKAPSNRNMKPNRSKDSLPTASAVAQDQRNQQPSIPSSTEPIYISIPIVAVGATGVDGRDGMQGATGMQGPVGREGQQGTTGMQGPAGSDGKPGATGVAGRDGRQGDTGIAGRDGQCGATGIQGPAGRDGKHGATGIQGPVGRDGKHGATGIQGPAGRDGQRGATGIQGPAGRDGQRGATGIQGPAGRDGQRGATGIQGPAGRDGQRGATGIQGPAGRDGQYGATGIQGPVGRDGQYGATGIQGPAGRDGQQGSTGIKGDTGVGLFQSRTIFVDPKYATGAFNQMEYRDLMARISPTSVSADVGSGTAASSYSPSAPTAENLNDLIESSSRPVASLQHALYLLQNFSLASSPPPSPETPWVIYFAPARHTIGDIRLAPNIYLCGTATTSSASDAATILEGTITVDPTMSHITTRSSFRDVGGLCDLTLQTTYAKAICSEEEAAGSIDSTNHISNYHVNTTMPLTLAPTFRGTFHVSRVHFDTTYRIAPPLQPITLPYEPKAVVQSIVRIVSGSLQSHQCKYSLNTQASYHEAHSLHQKKNTNVDCIFHIAPKPVTTTSSSSSSSLLSPSTLTVQGDTINLTTHNGYVDASVPRVAVTFVEEGTASTCTQISHSTIMFNIRNPFGVGHITPVNGTVIRHANARVRMSTGTISNSRVMWSDTTDYSNIVNNAKQNAFTLVWNDAPESELTASQVVVTVDSPILDPAIRHVVYMCNDAPLVPNEIYLDLVAQKKKTMPMLTDKNTMEADFTTKTTIETGNSINNKILMADINSVTSGPWVHIMDCSWTCPTLNRTSSLHSNTSSNTTSSTMANAELTPWVAPRIWIGSAKAVQQRQQQHHNHRLRYRITTHSGTLNTSAGLAFNTVTFRPQVYANNNDNEDVYTVTDKDGTVLVDATNAHCTILLAPSNVHVTAAAATANASVLPGRIVVIRRIDNSVANKLFIRASPGEYIETQTSMLLDIQESVMIQSTGHGMWRCISKKSNNAFMVSFVANGEYVLSYMNNQPTNCHYIGLGCNGPQFASVAFILPISGEDDDNNSAANSSFAALLPPSPITTTTTSSASVSSLSTANMFSRQNTNNNNNNDANLPTSINNSLLNTTVLNTLVTRMSVQSTNHPRNLLFFSGVVRVDVAFDIAMAPFGSNQPTSFSVEPVIISFTGENQICTGTMAPSNALTTIASNQLVALRARIVNVVYTDIPVPVQMTLTFSNAGVRLVQISK